MALILSISILVAVSAISGGAAAPDLEGINAACAKTKLQEVCKASLVSTYKAELLSTKDYNGLAGLCIDAAMQRTIDLDSMTIDLPVNSMYVQKCADAIDDCMDTLDSAQQDYRDGIFDQLAKLFKSAHDDAKACSQASGEAAKNDKEAETVKKMADHLMDLITVAQDLTGPVIQAKAASH